jgi:hypothetical protein
MNLFDGLGEVPSFNPIEYILKVESPHDPENSDWPIDSHCRDPPGFLRLTCEKARAKETRFSWRTDRETGGTAVCRF